MSPRHKKIIVDYQTLRRVCVASIAQDHGYSGTGSIYRILAKAGVARNRLPNLTNRDRCLVADYLADIPLRKIEAKYDLRGTGTIYRVLAKAGVTRDRSQRKPHIRREVRVPAPHKRLWNQHRGALLAYDGGMPVNDILNTFDVGTSKTFYRILRDSGRQPNRKRRFLGEAW